MNDDIFSQLLNLIDDKPDYLGDAANSGTGSSTSSSSGSSINDSSAMFAPDDMVIPDIKPRKVVRSKKQIVVIDDDFSTLDLMKIYLQRDYEYKPFDDAKNAIFYLNTNIPDLIFIDCYLNTMKTKRVVEIIRTYKELSNIPIIYLAEPSEQSAISGKLPEGVLDIISRPVKRADLQNILDTYVNKDDDGADDTNGIVDHPII